MELEPEIKVPRLECNRSLPEGVPFVNNMVIRKEAKKLKIDLKEAISTKAGETFKKAQDADHEVLKREHYKKVKSLIELNKRKAKEYMWTMTDRIKP
nr:hypothetical protein [Tanacetum cinerariifolium]